VESTQHANSQKDHRNQPKVRPLSLPRSLLLLSHPLTPSPLPAKVIASVCSQLASGSNGICGIMLESNLEEGAQKAPNGREGLKRGVSITDACVSWDVTKGLLRDLNAVRRSSSTLSSRDRSPACALVLTPASSTRPQAVDARREHN